MKFFRNKKLAETDVLLRFVTFILLILSKSSFFVPWCLGGSPESVPLINIRINADKFA